MSDFTNAVTVTVPANTSEGAPITIDATLGQCVVTTIHVVVPPGPSGLVGFAIYAGGSPAYPNVYNSWYVLDDYTLDLEVTNQITTGQWSIVAYNTDTNDHTLRFYFDCNNVQFAPAPMSSSPIAL